MTAFPDCKVEMKYINSRDFMLFNLMSEFTAVLFTAIVDFSGLCKPRMTVLLQLFAAKVPVVVIASNVMKMWKEFMVVLLSIAVVKLFVLKGRFLFVGLYLCHPPKVCHFLFLDNGFAKTLSWWG